MSNLPELVSFKFCPFAQRDLVIAREKGIDIKVTYINLKEPPQWFLEISPFKKVPLLRVGDAVLFESAAIGEYLDELKSPSLLPDDKLTRAVDRAWIVFASELNMTNSKLIKAATGDEFEQVRDSLRTQLAHLEPVVHGPYFNGEAFSLADAAYAPFFMRIAIVDEVSPLRLFEPDSVLASWSNRLLQRESVQQSVVEDFAAAYKAWVIGMGGHCSVLLS
ncbi:MAG: glutathione S-transferase family protein [Gammaproteobacteria bacterium]|nr:glutathione S-transferase family protein [Gammaproteobacteria bacterium]